MAMWGRMPLPPIPICPQEPWEAQEYAHRDRSRVTWSCNPPNLVRATALVVQYVDVARATGARGSFRAREAGARGPRNADAVEGAGM